MVKQKECRIMSEKQLRDLYSIDLNSNMAIQNKKREQCKFLRKYRNTQIKHNLKQKNRPYSQNQPPNATLCQY